VTFAQVGVGRTVLATVLNQRNQPVVDLDLDDFVVRETGRPREVLAARVADYPVVVLIDNSAQARGEFEAIRAAAARFITRVGQRPVALGTLGGTPVMVASAEDDRATVLSRLRAIEVEQTGGGQLVQGMAVAARALRALDVPFSAIVVLSTTPAVVADAPTEWLQQILDSRAIANVIINRAVSNSSPISETELRTLAEQTHGQLTTIYSAASYQVALDHLADQMAGEMMIDYVAGEAAPREDVTVGVRQPGLRVRGLGVR